MLLISTLTILLAVVMWTEADYYEPELLSPVELAQLEVMRLKILRMPLENFFNYHLMCSGSKSRVSLQARLVHKTVPSLYYDTILNTLHGSHSRRNRCPKWTSPNVHVTPQSGSMDQLVLDERTPVGHVVYLLSALDPEHKPLFYFLRKAENEPETSDDLFIVSQIKIGSNW